MLICSNVYVQIRKVIKVVPFGDTVPIMIPQYTRTQFIDVFGPPVDLLLHYRPHFVVHLIYVGAVKRPKSGERKTEVFRVSR